MNAMPQVTGLISQQAASARIPFDAPDVAPKTYVHFTPHSTFIDPVGIRHVFVPNKNPRVGELTTSSPHLQAELDAAIKKGAPIRLKGDDGDAPKVVEKTAAERAAELLGADKMAATQDAYIKAMEQKLADLISGKTTPEQVRAEMQPKESTDGKMISGVAASSTPSKVVAQAAADAKKRLELAQEQAKKDAPLIEVKIGDGTGVRG